MGAMEHLHLLKARKYSGTHQYLPVSYQKTAPLLGGLPVPNEPTTHATTEPHSTSRKPTQLFLCISLATAL